MPFVGDDNLAQKITDMQETLDRIAYKVDHFNGPHVNNDRTSMSIGAAPPHPDPIHVDPTLLLYTKLTAPWSSATANVLLGVSCPDATGANATSNVANVCLDWPPTVTPKNVTLVTNDVVAYVPFSGTQSGTLFGGGSYPIHGAAMPIISGSSSGSLSPGTLKYQVLQMSVDNPGGTATLSACTTWDFVRAHG